tara:strand:- start:589 stop:831 length:243 start_codon:yes stop_codon:yes gene_type:complete
MDFKAVHAAVYLAVLMAGASASETVLEARLTCKQMTSCEDAVMLWCNGYSRADGDNDGIPCENVCHSLREVMEIRQAIGC